MPSPRQTNVDQSQVLRGPGSVEVGAVGGGVITSRNSDSLNYGLNSESINSPTIKDSIDGFSRTNVGGNLQENAAAAAASEEEKERGSAREMTVVKEQRGIVTRDAESEGSEESAQSAKSAEYTMDATANQEEGQRRRPEEDMTNQERRRDDAAEDESQPEETASTTAVVDPKKASRDASINESNGSQRGEDDDDDVDSEDDEDENDENVANKQLKDGDLFDTEIQAKTDNVKVRKKSGNSRRNNNNAGNTNVRRRLNKKKKKGGIIGEEDQDVRAAMELEESFHDVVEFVRPTGITYVGGGSGGEGGANPTGVHPTGVHPVIKIETPMGDEGGVDNGHQNNNGYENEDEFSPDEIKIEPYDLDASGYHQDGGAGGVHFGNFNGAGRRGGNLGVGASQRGPDGNLTEEDYMKIEMPFAGEGEIPHSLMIANLGLGSLSLKILFYLICVCSGLLEKKTYKRLTCK